MYKYSPIKKIYIKNFRNIGEATIDFEESPIISLIGENEAGKTSVVKAFAVCALHATPRDQKDFIRDGSTAFGVAIELEDGTMVTRMKTATANRYSVKTPDGKEWDASKIDAGLPAAVQEVMGLIEEPETKEFLQVRTYEDQLLFVVTPASTNYKVMYDALKVDQLTRAIKIGSTEVNSLKSDISYNDNGIATLTSNLRELRIFDITPLLNIKSRLTKELESVCKIQHAYELLKSIEDKKMQIGALNELFSSGISEINESEASRIFNINRLIDNISRISSYNNSIAEIDTMENIDLTPYSKIVSIIDRKSKVANLKLQLGTLININEASEIDEMQLDHLIKATYMSRSINSKKRSLAVIEPTGASLVEQHDFDIVMKSEQIVSRIVRNKQLKESELQIDTFCKQVSDYLKSIGAAVEICPKCGESVVIDVEKYA